MDEIVRVFRPAFGNGDAREHRALHHHRIGNAEYKRLGRDALVLDVIKRPACGDTAFGAGRDQYLVLNVMTFQRMTRTLDQPTPSIEIVTRGKTFCGNQCLTFDHSAERALHAYGF